MVRSTICIEQTANHFPINAAAEEAGRGTLTPLVDDSSACHPAQGDCDTSSHTHAPETRDDACNGDPLTHI